MRHTAAPFRLPTSPVSFVGRGLELSQVLAAIEAEAVTGVGLFGQEGVGKTALALVIAKQLGNYYPDGQLWIDLQGHNGPLAPAAVMLQVIHACFPMARVPKDEAGIEAAYRRVLHGRRMLLLFDDTAGDAQIDALAPPAGCLMLVTSEAPLGLPGLWALGLDCLPQDDAKALLHRLAPRIGQDASRLATLCRQLPIALELVAGLLATRTDLTPGDYIQRLMAEQFRQVPRGEVDPVLAILVVNSDLLSVEQRRLWHQLAVFPADFGRRAAAAVWALDDDGAGKALEQFVRLGLVGYDRELNRYRLHGLVRRAANRRLRAAERQDARRRHTAHYCDVLAAADKLGGNGTDEMGAGLRLFDLERRNILAGQSWASEHAHEDKTVAKLASDYAAHGAHVLAARQPLHVQRSWLETAVEAARWLGDRKTESSHLGQLGSAFRHFGQPNQAIKYYEQCLRMAHEAKDLRGEGMVLEKIGMAYADLQEPWKAVDFYERSLRIARELKNAPDQARTSWNLGLAYQQLDNLPAAIASMQVCVDFERSIGHPNAEPDALEVEALRALLVRRSA